VNCELRTEIRSEAHFFIFLNHVQLYTSMFLLPARRT
jgi:hypothetical protein